MGVSIWSLHFEPLYDYITLSKSLPLFTHALYLNISSLPCAFPPRHSHAAADDGGPFDISELWGAASPDANPSTSETTSVTTTTSSSAIVAAPPARRQQQQLRASSASVGVRATASASKPARVAPQQSLPRRSTDQSARSDEATSGRCGVFAAGATPYRRVSWRQDDPPASVAPRPRPASAPRPQRPASVSAAFWRGGQTRLDDRSGGFGGVASAAAASIAAAAAPEALFPFKPELNPLSLRLAEASHPMLPGARIEQLAVPRSLVQAAKLDKVRMSNRATWAERWIRPNLVSISSSITMHQHVPSVHQSTREYASACFFYLCPCSWHQAHPCLCLFSILFACLSCLLGAPGARGGGAARVHLHTSHGPSAPAP